MISNLMMNGCWMPGGRVFRICATRCEHLELRVVEVGPEVEPHAHQRDPLLRGALHPIDARRSADGALDGLGDRSSRCRSGPAPGIKSRDADDGDRDVGEEIDREPADRDPAEHDDISDIIRMRTGLRSARRVSHMVRFPRR